MINDFRFGFVRNAAITKTFLSDEDPLFFIHSSGGMFVYIPNYYNNYSIRSRHTSANANAMNSSITTNNSNNSNAMTTTSPSTAVVTANSTTSSTNFKQPLLNQIGQQQTKSSNIDLNNDSKPTVESNSQQASGQKEYLIGGANHHAGYELISTPMPTGVNANKTSMNVSLSNSFVSGSNMNAVANFSSSTAMTLGATGGRERSHTKAQHLQFIKWNPYYSSKYLLLIYSKQYRIF